LTGLTEKRFSAQEIENLCSEYIPRGLREDRWEIVGLHSDPSHMEAEVRMKSIYTPPGDADGFHLSSISAFEMVSQLAVIYMHAWAGHEKKCREVWLAECSLRCNKAVRDRDRILVRMQAKTMRKLGDRLLAKFDAEVYDRHGRFSFSGTTFMG
jgi:hypothetical protein